MDELPTHETKDKMNPGLAYLLAVGCALLWTFLQLSMSSEMILPLSYTIPLLICVWTRSRRTVWVMAALFVVVAYVEIFRVLPAGAMSMEHRVASMAARLVNIGFATAIIHVLISLRASLERQNHALAQVNRQLHASNEELRQREEEIAAQNEELRAQSEELAQQNEELQVQGEELGQQAEELSSQSEEMATLNEELARRERMLESLLAAARSSDSEQSVLESVCRHGVELLGDDVVSALVIQSTGDGLQVAAHIDRAASTGRSAGWTTDCSLARAVMSEKCTAGLDDTRARPDLVFPRLEEGGEIRSALATPLLAGNQAIGAIEFYGTQPTAWSQDQFRLAEWVAAHASLIVESVRLRSQLQESEQRFRAIFEKAAIGIAQVGQDGRFLQVNGGFCAITGYSSEQLAAKSFADITHPDDLEADLGEARRLVAGEIAAYTLEKRYVRPDGTSVWVKLTASAVRGSGAGSIYYIAVVEDITLRKQIEEERGTLLEAERAARTEAERVNRLKDEFLATVSHELRSPLNAIVGWTRLLARGKAETVRAVEIIDRSASALTQLVEDLLDMSRIISGKIRLKREPADVVRIVRDVLEGVRPAAEAKNVHIDVSYDPHLRTLECDANRVQQVIWNLLTNAIKFTPGGGHVFVAVAQSDSGMEIVVRDTGQGILPEFLPQLFGRFRQADGSIARKHGGLGLGLSIVKHLVELHGGTVRADSAGANEGATFTVFLPCEDDRADDSPRHTPPRIARGVQPDDGSPADFQTLDGLDLVVIDDDCESCDLLARVLGEAGARVRVANSAEAGLELLNERKPDLLISDIGMPGQDGYSLLRQIRAADSELSDLTCLALTALARAEDRRRALEAGFDDHLAKPFDSSTLLSVAARLTRRGGITCSRPVNEVFPAHNGHPDEDHAASAE